MAKSLEDRVNSLGQRFDTSLIENRVPVQIQRKAYFHAAQAIRQLKNGHFVEANDALRKSVEFISPDMPHPPAVIAQQKTMIQTLQSELFGSKYRWELFVSYSSQDTHFVGQLVSQLKKHVSVFVDFDNIGLGDSITPKIEDGLRESQNVLMVVTRAFLEKRKWTDLERIWFELREQWVGQRKVIIILKDVTLSDFQTNYPTLADRRVLEFDPSKHPNFDAAIESAAREIVNSIKSSGNLQDRRARRS
jgi:hypothetical protein